MESLGWKHPKIARELAGMFFLAVGRKSEPYCQCTKIAKGAQDSAKLTTLRFLMCPVTIDEQTVYEFNAPMVDA